MLMGLQMPSQAIQFLPQFPLPVYQNCYGRFAVDTRPNSRTNFWRCFAGGRSGGSRWDCEKSGEPRQKSRFRMDDYDEEVEFGFGNAVKQRIWWCDDFEAEDDGDEEEDNGFGILQLSVGFDWVSKAFQAFGWMIPVVVVSLLMGTGPHSIIMAVALPLAQTAFSLATDMLFQRPDKPPRPKSKRKKRPFAETSGRTRMRREKQTCTERGKEAANYKSWVDANNFSAKNGKSGMQKFGGWDELDNQVRADKKPRVIRMKQEQKTELD